MRVRRQHFDCLTGVLLLAFGCLFGCHEERARPPIENTTLPALVAIAQSYHEQTDIAVEQNDLSAAEASMRELLEVLAKSEFEAPELLELGMDAHARLARLLLEQERSDEALSTIEGGLRFGRELQDSSIFAGYLLQTKGDILRREGDPRGAVDAHKKAIIVFKSILEKQSTNGGE